jgi:AraC family transcriptional regulator, transcriptional activator of pobA
VSWTPLAIVHDRRLIVEAQLEQAKLPVEQVGYSLGFRNPAHFNRFFQKQTGEVAYWRNCLHVGDQ